MNFNILNARSTFASNFYLLVYHVSLVVNAEFIMYQYFKRLNNLLS